ncbi:MAG: hypothetical protein H0Z32_12075 [Bacillaceae bacterium]|nr:hypothetical protein [Bacillaceae bacterium]
MKLILILASIFFGYLYLFSFLSKVRNIDEHISIIYQYKIIPYGFVNTFFKINLTVELVLSFMFLVGAKLILAIYLSITLLALYTIAILVNLFRGNTEIDCGCGGILGNHKLSYKLVFRNLLLIFLTIEVYFLYKNYSLLTIFQDKEFLLTQIVTIPFIFIVFSIKELIIIKRHLDFLTV